MTKIAKGVSHSVHVWAFTSRQRREAGDKETWPLSGDIYHLENAHCKNCKVFSELFDVWLPRAARCCESSTSNFNSAMLESSGLEYYVRSMVI
jgi:hypothetical protein